MPSRISPAFFVLRGLLIHKFAGAGTPTAEIAKALGVNRSYIIRQTTVELKPRTPAERRILKHAVEHQGAITRLGFGGLFRAEDITTILAGGERAKLGSLAERRAKGAPERRAVKKINAKPALKKAKLKRATPVEPLAAAPVAPSKPKRVRKPRPNAVQKMLEREGRAAESELSASADDILDAPPPPDMPL